ncbi:MAG: hypothetical protein GY774_10650 [Planctomycetes bacterium]|nr:hypothetical protein [Planctomycetota bacterium]
MFLNDLIVGAQNQSDEVIDKPDLLWSLAEWTEYANDAENEACIRANLLIDKSSALTSITIASGTGTYSIDAKILVIKRAKLASGTEPLVKTSRRVLDATYPNWEVDSGTVRSWLPDESNKITLYKKPSAGTTLNLMVSRLPLVAMTLADKLTVSPEIDEQYHEGLLDWMLHRAYSKQDAETLDTGKAKEHLKRFTARFGERPPAAAFVT